MTDRVAKGDLEIEHCPTDRMWNEIFTNPLQGITFSEFIAELMNFPVEYEDKVHVKMQARPQDYLI